MKALWIMYGIPLVALMVGTIGSYYVLKTMVGGEKLEIMAFFIGLIFTAAAFIGIRLRDAKFKESRQYLPVITRILIDIK